LIERRGEAQLVSAEARARAQRHAARRQIVAATADVLARARRLCEADGVVERLRVFLQDHGVGPRWQRRAGEDAAGVAPLEHGRRRTRAALAFEAQPPRPRAVEIAAVDGVAVHRAVIEARQPQAGDEVAREHPARRSAQTEPLDTERLDAIEHPSQSIGEGKHWKPRLGMGAGQKRAPRGRCRPHLWAISPVARRGKIGHGKIFGRWCVTAKNAGRSRSASAPFLPSGNTLRRESARVASRLVWPKCRACDVRTVAPCLYP
jgi:hypothetical protein